MYEKFQNVNNMWPIFYGKKIIKYIWTGIIFVHQLLREIYIVSHIIVISNYQEHEYRFYVERIIDESEDEYSPSKIYEYNDFIGKFVKLSLCGICKENNVDGIKPVCCLQKQEICINCLCDYINHHTQCKNGNLVCPFCRDTDFLIKNKIK